MSADQGARPAGGERREVPIAGNQKSGSLRDQKGTTAGERAPDVVIDVRGLNKHFGANHVVRDLALSVRRGEIFGFLGPNGSGKTTTIRMLCGLLTPDSGEGTCLGYDIRTDSYEIKRRAGYMTQRFSFWEDLTIRENLQFVARMYGMADRNAKVEASLDRLGLTARGNQLAGTLSGGWKQRIALAACLLHEPLLLLLDEPTAGVDPEARREFWEELHAFAATGITVLVSTHYMDEAERCHKLAYILNGRLLAQGTVEDVIAKQALVGWSVEGPDLPSLAKELRSVASVEQIAAFGGQLHVVGRDADRMTAELAPFRANSRYKWEPVQPGLEDVFIHLMRTAKDESDADRK
jgi:ABC-2 type transport system ATP-binding protein